MKNSDSFCARQLKTTTLSLDNLGVIFYVRTVCSDADQPLGPTHAHQHAWYEVHCIKKGSVRIQTDQKTITIKPNEILFLPERTYHITKTAESETLRVCIGFELFDNGKQPKENLYSSLAQPLSLVGTTKLSGCSSLTTMACQLANYLAHGGQIDHCRAHTILTHFLFLLCDKLLPPDNSENARMSAPVRRDARSDFNYLLDHLTSNEIDNLSLQDLSEKLYLSKKQINNMVKKRYHTTYKQKQIRFRMENAKKLLVETSLSVETIARQVGYTNLTAFYKAFANMTGVTPATYRSSHAEKPITP